MSSTNDFTVDLDSIRKHPLFYIAVAVLLFVIGMMVGKMFDNPEELSREEKIMVLADEFVEMHEFCVASICIDENMTFVEMRDLYYAYRTHAPAHGMVVVAYEMICGGFE